MFIDEENKIQLLLYILRFFIEKITAWIWLVGKISTAKMSNGSKRSFLLHLCFYAVVSATTLVHWSRTVVLNLLKCSTPIIFQTTLLLHCTAFLLKSITKAPHDVIAMHFVCDEFKYPLTILVTFLPYYLE